MKRLKQFAKNIRRKMVTSPMDRVIEMLRQKGVEVGLLRALEMFAARGEIHTRDYAQLVRSIDAWEIDGSLQAELQQNVPEAHVSIGDAYAMLRESAKSYDLIVIDNPLSMHGEHCEHFDVFPDVFSILSSGGVLVFNVVPAIDDRVREMYPYMFSEEHLAKRTAFYARSDVETIELEELKKHYVGLAERAGRRVEWCESVQRNFLHYMILRLS